MKRIAIILTAVLCTAAAFADVSKKYSDWARSPQAYFMTKADRAQWAKVRSDAEAEQFVNDFIAKRGGESFVKEVAQNAAQSDKYLTIGKTPGSLTTRGKMMILLGPAVPTNITKKKRSGDVRLAPGSAGGDFGGATMGEMQDAANGPGNSTFTVTEYTYTYPVAVLPAAYGKPLTIKIEVDPGRDEDRVSSFGGERELDKVYEMVAEARLAAAKQPTP